MANVSIRENKRQLMAGNIQRIADEMALKKGITKVMVEDIANAAAISRRTFFNYFSTKEDSILGLQSPKLSLEARDTFINSEGSVLARTVQLIIDVNSTAIVPGVSVKSHIDARKRHPELRPRIDYYTARCEQIITPLLAEYVDDTIDAEVVLRTAGAIIRYAYSNNADLTATSVSNSIQTFTETIKRIS